MSLINSMLAGLEDRQAYMSEGQDLVLEGLTSVNDDSFQDSKQKSNGYIFVILLLAGLVFSVYMYAHYFANKTIPQKADTSVASESQVRQLPPVAAGDKVTGRTITVSKPLPQQQSHHVNTISLKMDYSITGAASATPEHEAQDVEAAEVSKDVPQIAAAAVPSIESFNVSSIGGSSSSVSLSLNGISDYRVYELSKPYRVAVEFDKNLSLPESIPKKFEHGLVSRIRGHHIYNNKRTLVVLDLSAKGVVQNSEIQETGGSYVLTVSISPVHSKKADVTSNKDKLADSPRTPVAVADTGEHKGTLSVTRNNSTPDQVLARGLNDYQKGNVRDGLEQITNALEMDPKYTKARSTLVNLLIEQNEIPAAIHILDDGITLLPKQYSWRELKAKLLVKLNRYDDAIDVLSQSGPDVNTNPEYFAFLAALLQQQGRNDEAVGYYRNVVAVRGDNGVWWMGLGISLERTGQPAQAEDAYRKAIRDNSLAPDIRNYVKNRITVLSGQ